MKKRQMVNLMTMAITVSMAACGESSKGGTKNVGGSTPAGTMATEAGASGGTQTADADEPVDDGVLTISFSSSSKNLDPVKYIGTYESQIIRSICDTPVEHNSSLAEIMPFIVASQEVSSDGKEHVFGLKDDVYFQPGQYQGGRQVMAEDIKHSPERPHELPVMNRLDMLDHCKVISDTEVKCVLENPNAIFLIALTNTGNVIVPKEKVEGQGDDFGTHLVRNGPFALEKFKLNQQATLARNEKYWAQRPHLDEMVLRPASDGNQAVNVLGTEEVNVATNLTGETVQVARSDDTVKLLEMPGLHVSYLYSNMVNGPTKDPKAREALVKAVNMEELTGDVYQYGEAIPASLLLPPGSWEYDGAVKAEVPTCDPEAAKALLTGASYPDRFDLSLYISNTPTRVKMVALFQTYLQQNLNVNVNINTNGWGALDEVGVSGRADVLGMSWAWYSDPYFLLNRLFCGGKIDSLGNSQGHNNPEVDECPEDALLTTDQSERADLYKKALALTVKDMPGIFCANENVKWGVAPNVQGLVQRADSKVEICTADTNIWLSKQGSRATVLYQYRLDGASTGSTVLWWHPCLKRSLMTSILKTLVSRCLQIIPVLFVVITLTFVLTRVIPNDPARAVAGPQASIQNVEKLRESMGLNGPMPVRYKDYVLGVLQGDLGTPYSYNQPVLKLMAEGISNTLLLAIPSIAVALLIGMVIGVASAVKQGSLFDYIFMMLALIEISMPIFWMGLMLVLTFSVRLGWLPVLGMEAFENGLGDVICHMVLPCFYLSTIPVAIFARITCFSTLESISSDSMRAIRARGIRGAIVTWKYALKNALPPIAIVLGLQLASCFAGAILTENMFSWPGMGLLMTDAIDNRDYMLVQDAVLVIAPAFALVNLAVDIAYMLVNPRISYGGGS